MAMKSAVKAPVAPGEILRELGKHPLVVNEKALVLHIKGASAILEKMSVPQLERIVHDELDGSIATLIGMVCTRKANSAVVMVTSSSKKQYYAELLSITVRALNSMGYLPDGYETVTVKEPKGRYFCRRRFDSAAANGAEYSDAVAHYLTVARMSKDDAGKLCVQTCSRSCRHYDDCKYQTFLAQMQAGDHKIQVYDVAQYRSAYRTGKLPKARMTIVTATGRRVLEEPGATVFTEAELLKLLSMCETGCYGPKKIHRIVYANTAAARKSADKLFAMAIDQNEYDEEMAKAELRAISERLVKIRDGYKKYLRKTEDNETVLAMFRTIRKINGLLESESRLDVTHKNWGKYTLVGERPRQ